MTLCYSGSLYVMGLLYMLCVKTRFLRLKQSHRPDLVLYDLPFCLFLIIPYHTHLIAIRCVQSIKDTILLLPYPHPLSITQIV